jgi:hypothetical protein
LTSGNEWRLGGEEEDGGRKANGRAERYRGKCGGARKGKW